MADLSATRVGPGRVLLYLYGLFVVAAGARSIVQLVLHAARAPLAYALSAGAAAVYATGFLLVRRVDRRPTARHRRAARWSCVVELCGVLVVGTASLGAPGAFADGTVWSAYGAGYLFVPLVLPLATLWWLAESARRSTRQRRDPTESGTIRRSGSMSA